MFDQAIQVNIFTAVLCALKNLAESNSKSSSKESRTTLGGDDVRKAAIDLILDALTNPNPILRCAAGEALGRMAQVSLVSSESRAYSVRGTLTNASFIRHILGST